MKITLPYPPTGNLYWRHWRNRVVRSPEATKYRQGVRLRALSQGLRPTTEEVVLSVAMYRPRRMGDLDNSLKVLIDALRGVAFEDDSQVVEIHAIRFEDKANPRAEVTVEPQRRAA